MVIRIKHASDLGPLIRAVRRRQGMLPSGSRCSNGTTTAYWFSIG